MEKLSALPTLNKKQTDQEEEVMDRIFGDASQTNPDPDTNNGDTTFSPWKFILYAIISFIIIGNPWIDSIVCKIPYCSNVIPLFVAKVVLFALFLVLIYFFLL